MRSRSTAVLCLLAGLLAGGRAAADEAGESALRSQIEAAARQVAELELAVEQEKRFYPPAEMWGESFTGLMRRARAAGIPALRATPVTVAPILLESGQPSPLEVWRVTLTGQAEYDAVHRFVASLAGAPQRVDLESVQLVAAPKGMVEFTLALGMPVYVGEPAPSRPLRRVPATGARTPEEAAAMAREAVLRARLEELSSRAARLQALQRVFARYAERSARAGVFPALAQFHRACGSLDVALLELRIEDAITIAGVAIGAAARAGAGPALAAAGLSAGPVPFSRQGSCHRFSVGAALPVREIEDAGVSGNGPFDAVAGSSCAPAEGRARGRIAARGSAPDGITLRLRGVDASDLFRVLGRVTPLGFVVDGDVDGRVDVDYDRPSLDDAFAALGTAGLVGQVGALVRVSNAAAGVTVAPSKAEYNGEPVTLDIKDADLRDVFRLFGEISGLRYEVPKAFEGRASVFVTDVAWDRVVDALVDAAGLRSRIDGARVVLEEKGPRRPPAPAPVSRRHPRQADKIGVEDLMPVGAALVDGAWQAYAYGPGRVLWTLAPGSRFFDGEVKAVTAAAVTFDVAGKTVEMKLP